MGDNTAITHLAPLARWAKHRTGQVVIPEDAIPTDIREEATAWLSAMTHSMTM